MLIVIELVVVAMLVVAVLFLTSRQDEGQGRGVDGRVCAAGLDPREYRVGASRNFAKCLDGLGEMRTRRK